MQNEKGEKANFISFLIIILINIFKFKIDLQNYNGFSHLKMQRSDIRTSSIFDDPCLLFLNNHQKYTARADDVVPRTHHAHATFMSRAYQVVSTHPYDFRLNQSV